MSSSSPRIKSTCDACEFAKVRCSRDKPTCRRCESHGRRCVYNHTRKLGRPRKVANSGVAEEGIQAPQTQIRSRSQRSSPVNAPSSASEDVAMFDPPINAQYDYDSKDFAAIQSYNDFCYSTEGLGDFAHGPGGSAYPRPATMEQNQQPGFRVDSNAIEDVWPNADQHASQYPSPNFLMVPVDMNRNTVAPDWTLLPTSISASSVSPSLANYPLDTPEVDYTNAMHLDAGRGYLPFHNLNAHQFSTPSRSQVDARSPTSSRAAPLSPNKPLLSAANTAVLPNANYAPASPGRPWCAQASPAISRAGTDGRSHHPRSLSHSYPLIRSRSPANSLASTASDGGEEYKANHGYSVSGQAQCNCHASVSQLMSALTEQSQTQPAVNSLSLPRHHAPSTVSSMSASRPRQSRTRSDNSTPRPAGGRMLATQSQSSTTAASSVEQVFLLEHALQKNASKILECSLCTGNRVRTIVMLGICVDKMVDLFRVAIASTSERGFHAMLSDDESGREEYVLHSLRTKVSRTAMLVRRLHAFLQSVPPSPQASAAATLLHKTVIRLQDL